MALEMNEGLDSFIALTQKYVDVEELTPTIVNKYIKKIVVYAPDKSGGRRTQKNGVTLAVTPFSAPVQDKIVTCHY